MDRQRLVELLNAIASGTTTPAQAYNHLQFLPFADLGFAKADLHRDLRNGAPEAIYAPGKTAEQICGIAAEMRKHHSVVVATRVEPDTAAGVISISSEARYHAVPRILLWGDLPEPRDGLLPVAVVSAGTADLPVAEEAALILETCATPVRRLSDVGVAGIHRLLGNLDALNGVSAVIVVAGMDGALPSVVGGLVAAPVIAVPTATGYGSGAHGFAALFTMLNSCAAGVTVVNIDNGFGAAMAAMRIANLSAETAAAKANAGSRPLPLGQAAPLAAAESGIP